MVLCSLHMQVCRRWWPHHGMATEWLGPFMTLSRLLTQGTDSFDLTLLVLHEKCSPGLVSGCSGSKHRRGLPELLALASYFAEAAAGADLVTCDS